MDAFNAYKKFLLSRYDDSVSTSESEDQLKKAFDADPWNFHIMSTILKRNSVFVKEEFMVKSLQPFITHFPFHRVLENDPYELLSGNVTCPFPYKDFSEQIKNDPELKNGNYSELYRLNELNEFYERILQVLIENGESESAFHSLADVCGLTSFDFWHIGLHIGKDEFDRIRDDVARNSFNEWKEENGWFFDGYPPDARILFLEKAVKMGNMRLKQVYELLYADKNEKNIAAQINEYFSKYGYNISLLFRLMNIVYKNAFSEQEAESSPGFHQTEFLHQFIKRTYFLPLHLKYFFAGGKNHYLELENFCKFECKSLYLEKKGAFHLYVFAHADSSRKEKELSTWQRLTVLFKAHTLAEKNIQIIYSILKIWKEHPLKKFKENTINLVKELSGTIDFKKPLTSLTLFLEDTLRKEELSLFTIFERSELNEKIIYDCFKEKIDTIDEDSLFEIPGRLSLFSLIVQTYERAGEYSTATELLGEYCFFSPADYMYHYTMVAQYPVLYKKYRSEVQLDVDDYFESEQEYNKKKEAYDKDYSYEEKLNLVQYNESRYLKIVEKKFENVSFTVEEVLLLFNTLSYALCRDSDRNKDNSSDKFRAINREYYEKRKDEINTFNKKYGTSVMGIALYTACYIMLLPGSLKQAYDAVKHLIQYCYYLHYSQKRTGISYHIAGILYKKVKEMWDNQGVYKSLFPGSSFIAFYGKKKYFPLKETKEEKDFYIVQPFIKQFLSKKDSPELRTIEMLTRGGMDIFQRIHTVKEIIPIHLGVVTSEKKVYLRTERPVLFFVFPGKKNIEYTFSVYSFAKKMTIIEKSMNTDDWGIAAYSFTHCLDVDEYRVTINTIRSAGYIFTVTDFSYSPLYVAVEKEEKKEDTLFIHLNVELFNLPYNGELTYEYDSEYLSLINGEDKECIDIINGKGIIKLETGYFNKIRFVTPDGYTAQIKKQGKYSGCEVDINCDTYGYGFFDSEGIPFWGFGLKWGTITKPEIYEMYDAFEIEKLFESKNIIIRFHKNIKYGKVTVINEQNAVSSSIEFMNKKTGSSLTLKGSDVYSIVDIGGLCGDDGVFYERRALVLFMPPGLSLSVPEKARTGEEVEIVIKSTKKCRAIVSVVDAGIEKEYCDRKLGEQLVDYLKEYKYESNRIENYLQTCIDDIDPLSSLFHDYDKVFENIRRCHSVVRADIAQEFGVSDTPDSEKGENTEEAVDERKNFKDILFFDIIDVDEEIYRQEQQSVPDMVEKIITITLNDRITTWDIHVTAVYENTISSARAQLAASNDFYLELDLPAFISSGDTVKTRAFAFLGRNKEAFLHIKTPDNEYSEKIMQTGFKEIELTGPGKIEAGLTSGKKKDLIVREISKPGLFTIYTQRLAYLNAGDTIEIDNNDSDIDIYENEIYFAKNVIDALVRYPFGCSEQTTSKLNGLVHAWKALQKGLTGFNKDEIDTLIVSGLNRLPLFFTRDNLFSFWENGRSSPYVTEKVIINLFPFLDTKYEEAIMYIEKAKKALREKNYKSNSLVSLDTAFKKYNDIRCIDDACEFYFAEVDPCLDPCLDSSLKEKCVEYLIENAHIMNGTAFWHGNWYWGGIAEATSKACKVLYNSKQDALFQKGLSFLSTKLKNNMLYSTSDTSALIDLFMYIFEKNEPATAIIDGKECRIKGRMNGKKVTLKSGKVFISIKKREVMDVLDSKADNLKLDISINKINCRIADTLTMSITVNEDIKCPVVSIYIPPVLCSLKHGIRVQTIVTPLKYNTDSFDFTGVKIGTGKLYVLVYDMYEEDKRGYYCGDVVVQERKKGATFTGSKSKKPGKMKKKGRSELSEI